MVGVGESDEHRVERVLSPALHGLLAGLNLSHQPSQLSHAQNPTWGFPSATSPRNTPSPTLIESSTSGSIFSPRPAAHRGANSAPELDAAENLPPSQLAAPFGTPNRSIFSGPPTSSLSSNTAQASMSHPAPANSSVPLSALSGPSNPGRKPAHFQNDGPSSSRKTRISRAEKDNDDPSDSTGRTRSADKRGASTPTAVTRLFAAPEAVTPTVSRQASYIRTPSGATYTRASLSEIAPLPNHLYNRGLLSGKHSDITIHAFGTRYALHRLLLDRAPFFSSALSEPWFESTSKEMAIQPDDIDSNITQTAFELALKRLYGCSTSAEEEKEAIGLFATGCWLEMADLIDSSVTAILRQMSVSNLSSLIRLVTNNYYGKPGERILASAKAMLCREGWEMPIRHWDGISGEIAREIIGGDGFFVPGEWERWVLAKKVLDRKLKARAAEAGLVEANGKIRRAPQDNMNFLAIRFDGVYRKSSSVVHHSIPEAYDPFLALYTCQDIAALLVLLDEGIHYVHLSFEQLQTIRNKKDALGLPVMPERVISNALWMSMELRQLVANANEDDMELGLAQVSNENLEQATETNNVVSISNGKEKEHEFGGHGEEDDDEMDSGSWDGNGKPRKFWIPSTDSTQVMGGNPDSLVSTATGVRPYISPQLSRLSASIDPTDVQWASDFTASVNERPQTPGRPVSSEPTPSISYTHFPPFRFAAEFPNPRSLKEKKRVYSRTVWYAGSLWNVYIQKVETTKNTQLGVYLHRAKEKEGTEEPRPGSVDERIGQVEMLMRQNLRNRRRQSAQDHRDIDEDDGSSGDPDTTLVSRSHQHRSNMLSSLLRDNGVMKSSQSPGTLALSALPDRMYRQPVSSLGSDSEDPDLDPPSAGNRRSSTTKAPALPPYVDGRPTIKTYFKIYSPSKGGRMLSVYESAPDSFNFAQSWGWKSSTMVLDDGLLGYEEGGRSKDGRLRFMVVIGNV